MFRNNQQHFITKYPRRFFPRKSNEHTSNRLGCLCTRQSFCGSFGWIGKCNFRICYMRFDYSRQCNNTKLVCIQTPQFKTLSIYTKSVILIGDISVFVLFVIIGDSDHEIQYTNTLLRTSLPFGICWIAISPAFGTFKHSTITDLRMILVKIPLTWIFCGVVAIIIRSGMADMPFLWSFTLVSIIVQGILLTSWRILVNRTLRFL